MLKIVIFCGGTGSVALQKGFSQLYGYGRTKVDVVVNAYDNGKSTGACRRIFENKILGPSDVRKNQLLQFAEQYAAELKDKNSRMSRLYRLFEIRLSADSPASYYKAAKIEMEQCRDILSDEHWRYLDSLLSFFFFEDTAKEPWVERAATRKESFEDFALSNIFYSACAALNSNSLEAALDIMADIMEIGHNVHMISGKNLFLSAETESGRLIEDEGDIVAWDNPSDKIIRAVLRDESSEYLPAVDEQTIDARHQIRNLVSEADIVILSSGTQWSSLIPTYMHSGFREMLEQTTAKKYLIMNNIEDHDALGVNASELCSVLENYINMEEITIIANENAVESMREIPAKYHSIRKSLSANGEKKHAPGKLVSAIMQDYYGEALSCGTQYFDLDGTLWNEKGTEAEKEVCRENLQLYSGAILSGNSYEHVLGVLSANVPADKEMEVYTDYGNTHFMLSDPKSVRYLTDEYDLSVELYQKIKNLDSLRDKTVVLRGKTVITIKPVEDRNQMAVMLNQEILGDSDGKLVARIAGRTSIDIMHARYTKAEMLGYILAKQGIKHSEVLFVGNELKNGSEVGIGKLDIKTLSVNDVYDCNVFLKTQHMRDVTEM